MINVYETESAGNCLLSYIKQLINKLGLWCMWNNKEQFNEHVFT